MTEIERVAALLNQTPAEIAAAARKVQRERRLQSLMIAAVVAWAGWQSTATIEQKVTLAVVTEQQNAIIRDVARTRTDLQDLQLQVNYRGAMVGPKPPEH